MRPTLAACPAPSSSQKGMKVAPPPTPTARGDTGPAVLRDIVGRQIPAGYNMPPSPSQR
jgi:hypothetical protein